MRLLLVRLRSAWLIVGSLLVSGLSFSAPAAGQQLQTLRDEVRVDDPDPPHSPASSGGSSPHHDHDYDHYDGDSYGDDGESLEGYLALGALAGVGITSPYWLPFAWLDDSPSKTGYFPAHPYQYDVGYMLIEPADVPPAIPRQPYSWAVRARGEFGMAITGLDWFGANVVIENVTRIGLESDLRFYQEDISNVFQSQLDDAYLGDVNLVYRFAQNEYWQFRSGLGVNFLSDRQQSDLGFNFTYGFDAYPLKPWIVSAEVDWGLLGDETLIHFRLSTGLQWNGLEAFIAYDLYDVGKFDNASLVTGLRLWF